MTRDAMPFPSTVAAVEATVEPDDGDDLGLRQCGRCRMMFAGDPELDTRGRNDWCLCPACEAILLPVRAGRANLIAVPTPGAGQG